MGLFRKGKSCIISKVHGTDLVICSHSREGKTHLIAVKIQYMKNEKNSNVDNGHLEKILMLIMGIWRGFQWKIFLLFLKLPWLSKTFYQTAYCRALLVQSLVKVEGKQPVWQCVEFTTKLSPTSHSYYSLSTDSVSHSPEWREVVV